MIIKKLAIFGGRPEFQHVLLKPSPIGREEVGAALKVLKKGILSRAGRGEYVKKFELKFASYFHIKYALSTTSGTSALHTALSSLNLSVGDEVMVPSLTFISSASVILQQRLKPLFIDIDPKTLCLDVEDVKKKLTKKTKAIIVVHLYGNSVKMDYLMKVARKHKLRVIEDCAQAHGAKYKGKYLGTFGDLGCFSFYQTKNMTCGEGGMIITNNGSLYKNCVSISDHGLINNNLQAYNYNRLGYNYHLTEMQAAIGIEQLKKLKKNNLIRKKNSSIYVMRMAKTKLTFQMTENKTENVFYALTALLPKKLRLQRDLFVDAIRRENVEINKIYPIPLHKTKLFKELGYQGACPVAEDVAARLFNFYTNPGITEEYIERACVAVEKVIRSLEKNEKN